MSFIYALNDTWNNGATTFAGIQLNASNGAGGAPVYAAGSMLMNLQINGVSQFSIAPTNTVAAPILSLFGDTGAGWYRIAGSQWGFAAAGGDVARLLANNFNMASGVTLGWMSSTDYSGSIDTKLTRSAAGIIGVTTGFLLGAGTTAIAPLQYTSGTNLTSPLAGAREFDGAQHYATIDTSSGRAALAAEQYFHLTANGGTISTIANFFGTTSNISLVASAHYIIDIEAWFSVQTGTQTVTWTLTNSAAPTSQNIDFMMSPVTGMIAPPGTATMLEGQFQNDATAARTITTGALTSGITVYTRMRIWLINSTGTSLLIQATSSANTITPLAGSWWRCRRVSPGNIGTFHA